MEYIAFIVIGTVGIAWLAIRSQIKNEKSFSNALSISADFNPDYQYVSPYMNGGIAIDASRRKLAVSYGSQRPLCVIEASSVSSIEVINNNSTIHKTNRGGQVAGAAVGGLLLGPVGLLVGGLTASTRTSENVSLLALRVRTNDVSNPLHDIIFYKSAGEKADSFVVKTQVEQLDMWHARLSALISS